MKHETHKTIPLMNDKKENVEIIKIDTCDVILQDFEPGNGKIIISDNSCGYNFSYHWGSMGKESDLKDFILRINSDYFTDKLSSPFAKGEINSRKTFANIRKAIAIELPWYKHTEFQKNIRESLNNLQKCFYDENYLINQLSSFIDNKLNFYLIEKEWERKSIKESLKSVFSEVWNYFEYHDPKEHVYLKKLHKKLIKKLK